MLVLFKKDLSISAKHIILFMVLGFLLGTRGFMLNDYFVGQMIYVTTVLFCTLGILTNIVTEDDKYNTEMLFNSLAIDRKTIVISKYFSISTLPFLFGISFYVFSKFYDISDSLMFMFTPKNLFTFEMMIFSIASSFIALSLYLPLYYYSIGKARMIGSGVMITIFLVPIVILRFTEGIGDLLIVTQYMQSLNLNLMLLAISIILYILSFQLSLSIYNRKEF